MFPGHKMKPRKATDPNLNPSVTAPSHKRTLWWSSNSFFDCSSPFQPSSIEGANNLNATNVLLHLSRAIRAIIDLARAAQSK